MGCNLSLRSFQKISLIVFELHNYMDLKKIKQFGCNDFHFGEKKNEKTCATWSKVFLAQPILGVELESGLKKCISHRIHENSRQSCT